MKNKWTRIGAIILVLSVVALGFSFFNYTAKAKQAKDNNFTYEKIKTDESAKKKDLDEAKAGYDKQNEKLVGLQKDLDKQKKDYETVANDKDSEVYKMKEQVKVFREEIIPYMVNLEKLLNL